MKALVLSGGGVKGAYQVGALKKWLFDDWQDYDIFCGVSVGAINGAFLSQFPKGDPKAAYEKLEGVWAKVNQSNVKKAWFPLSVVESLWKPSVYNSEPLQKWIFSELDQKKVAASGKKLRVVAVSWNTGDTWVADETSEEIAKWVLASASFPVMLTPVEIDGQLWTDGGVRNVTPLGEAIRAGADEIDVIVCSNPDLPHRFDAQGKAALPSLAFRAIDMMGDQIVRADLQMCGLKNDLAELKPKYKKVKVRVLQPKESLTDDSLDFDPAAIQRMMALGYRDACELT
jgi:NTE family protein